MNTSFISIKAKEKEDIERNHPCCIMNTSFVCKYKSKGEGRY
jgi:hypothetical protein